MYEAQFLLGFCTRQKTFKTRVNERQTRPVFSTQYPSPLTPNNVSIRSSIINNLDELRMDLVRGIKSHTSPKSHFLREEALRRALNSATANFASLSFTAFLSSSVHVQQIRFYNPQHFSGPNPSNEPANRPFIHPLNRRITGSSSRTNERTNQHSLIDSLRFFAVNNLSTHLLNGKRTLALSGYCAILSILFSYSLPSPLCRAQDDEELAQKSGHRTVVRGVRFFSDNVDGRSTTAHRGDYSLSLLLAAFGDCFDPSFYTQLK